MLFVSPHNASASENAARMLRENAAGIISKAIRGEPLPNVVNGVLARNPYAALCNFRWEYALLRRRGSSRVPEDF